jgi:transcriptional regulator with XRE-family HTH domain
MDIGAKIKRAREQAGLTQAELAKKAGVKQARISLWESGKRQQMSLEHLRSIARALGVSADFLIGTWEDLQEEAATPS